MKVSECMTRQVEVANPDDTVQQAAQAMARLDSGALPVGENDRLVGMITDRDIAIRAVAAGKKPESTTVREIMTAEVRYCFEDEDIDDVAENMAEQKIRRLPVVNRDKRLTGIIALGDIARGRGREAGEALEGISQPGGKHSQRRPNA